MKTRVVQRLAHRIFCLLAPFLLERKAQVAEDGLHVLPSLPYIVGVDLGVVERLVAVEFAVHFGGLRCVVLCCAVLCYVVL